MDALPFEQQGSRSLDLYVGWTEARESSNGRRHRTECLDWSREMAGRYHHPIPNQRAAHECTQLQRPPGFIDAPNHDRPDIRVSVLGINAYLSRHCY